MTEQKQGLQKGKSFAVVTGKAKINEKTFSGDMTSDKTGYVYTRLNLGVEIRKGSVIYTEQMGGYAPDKPVIYSMNKEDNSQVEINFADRLNEKVVESVADFKTLKVGLERDDKGELIIKKFLSPMDVHDYLKEHLKDGMEVTVRGSFKFSEYNDNVQRKFEIQNIFLPYPQKDKETGEVLPTEYKAVFTQTILVDEDSFEKITPQDKKDGEVVIKSFAVDYVGKKNGKQIKKNLPFRLPITVKINKEKPELTEKIIEKLFDVPKGKVRELTIEGDIIEGYDEQEVSEQDIELSDEIKELIELGLYSEEEAKAKMTVRGNKVSKLVFTRPHLAKDKNDNNRTKMDINDEKYTVTDLFPPVVEKEEEKKDELPDLTGGTDDAPVDDNVWMSELGI